MFDNLDDPQKQMLLMLGAGLLSPTNKKGFAGFGDAMSKAIPQGLLGYTAATESKRRNAMADMQNKLMQGRMDDADKARQAQDYMGKGIQQYMNPGSPSVPFNDALGDGSQGTIPGQAPSFDRQGFAGYLAQNPQTAPKALDFMPQQQAPQRPLVVGKSLVDPSTGKPIYTEPEPKQEAKPNYKDYPSNGRIVRVFNDGTSRVVYDAPKGAPGPAPAPKPTPAQTAVDKAYAKDYLEWTQGGKADAEKSIGQMREVSERLGSSDNISGGVVGNIPHSVRSTLGMESADVQDQVEEIVQRNLRLILGAQFTEKEGARLIARAYNPRLGEKENKARVDRLLKQIGEAAQAKQSQAEYFESNGTLNGWTGKVWSMADFDPEGNNARRKTGSVGSSGGWSIQRVN